MPRGRKLQLAEVIEGGPLDAPIADAKLHKMDRGDFTDGGGLRPRFPASR